uniref:TAFH domain-containing protein n=1 Tax=Zonotrichia albicollis TaxID=44394 RepID=A0A8D2MN25_ZONAL
MSPGVPCTPDPSLAGNPSPAWHTLLTSPCPLPADNAETAAMPDSPADVKTQARSSPPSMPPPAAQGASRHPSFTPSTMMNGSSHSPTAINGAPSTPNGFSNGPATSSSASLSTHQLPPACGARQLSKLKRFLTTLQQFGNDISPEIGERVRTLVLGLVNSTLTIEEFHAKLQEATNFPLRPFVIPFLKVGLQPGQGGIHGCISAQGIWGCLRGWQLPVALPVSPQAHMPPHMWSYAGPGLVAIKRGVSPPGCHLQLQIH